MNRLAVRGRCGGLVALLALGSACINGEVITVRKATTASIPMVSLWIVGVRKEASIAALCLIQYSLIRYCNLSCSERGGYKIVWYYATRMNRGRDQTQIRGRLSSFLPNMDAIASQMGKGITRDANARSRT